MPYLNWAEEKRRQEVAARKAAEEANRDPVMEQCVIAFVSHRRNGGTEGWDDYRARWLRDNGAAEERRVGHTPSGQHLHASTNGDE
jgi:hypothetical protein